ncbi:Adaptin N terminal region family protein [Tritrichomonas foetus]|uniref:AP-1 complex subunit gamma n=1 Tax=Tritrichomonas foetus TaxID=1144522 RepID=A0A1J4JBV4_9EUKA|nr:Adaptin N terminal region family protein [Tritrichomonas foetus]|eukprot:OHS94893.1 Adaptin N terminal region family protein [Tritrichomonas foetus]
MSTRTQPFIQSLITAPTIEQERVLITNELANMRTLIKEANERMMPRIMSKIIYLTMIGYDTAWGQMEIINLMTHERPSYKRMAYLAASLMFDANNERIVLITASVQKDLNHSNPVVQRMALTLISNICSAEMGQSLMTDVIRLASSSDPHVQKCAGMAAAHIIRKCPEISEQFRPIVAPMLNHGYHCVVAAGINVAIEMLKVDPQLAEPWSQFAIPFTKILKTLFDTRATQEFSFGIFNDPFLQIKIMQILSFIKFPSDELDDVLSSIVTSVDVQRNTGRSLLLQAVQTIGLTAKKPSLRSLAFNQVGRLFTFPQPNLLYSALSMFSRILYNNSTIIDRSSSDSLVLQRYKSQVVHCLDHRDPSIRRRALDVVAALVDDTNVETLIPEIMTYLKLADGDFRTELVAKVFASVQRFSPSVTWNFDTTLKILKDSGSYVGNDVITAFCRLIAQNPDLRPHAISELYNALKSDIETQPLIQVAAWALGEFQEEPSDSIEVMSKLLSMPQTSVDSKGYLITAISKLAVRFNIVEPVNMVLQTMAKNNNLEVQQRAGEMIRVLEKTSLCEDILAPIEVEELDQSGKPLNTPTSGESADLLGGASEPKQTTGLDLLEADDTDLLLDFGDAPSPAAPATSQPQQPPAKPAEPEKPTVKPEDIVPPQGSVEALRTSDYVVFFELQRNAQNPRQLAIRSTVFNLNNVPLTQFLIQYGVPNGWAIVANAPSSNVLEPIGGRPIQQILMLENRGNNPLMMITQTSFMYRSQPIKENGKINPIFG